MESITADELFFFDAKPGAFFLYEAFRKAVANCGSQRQLVRS